MDSETHNLAKDLRAEALRLRGSENATADLLDRAGVAIVLLAMKVDGLKRLAEGANSIIDELVRS